MTAKEEQLERDVREWKEHWIAERARREALEAENGLLKRSLEALAKALAEGPDKAQ
jgi:hypothetical protein